MKLQRLITDSFRYCSSLVENSPLPNWLAWGVLAGATTYLAVILNFATSSVPFLFMWPFVIVGSFMLVTQLYQTLDGLVLVDDAKKRTISPRKCFLCVFAVYTILILLSGGAHAIDFKNQWAQAISGCYDDWHPMILPLVLRPIAFVTQSPWPVNLLQIVLFAAIVAWFVRTLLRHNYSHRIIKILFLLLVASPTSFLMVRTCLKDTFFGLSAFAMVVAMINIWHTQGGWLKNGAHIVLLSAVVVFATFVRHNGFFFTLPFVILLPLLFDRKGIVPLLLCWGVVGLGCFGYIQLKHHWVKTGVVHTSTNQRFTEAVLLPMSMLAEAHVDKGRLPDKLEKLLCEMGDMERWSHNYRGNINSIKSDIDIDPVLNKRTTPKEFMLLFLRGFLQSPKKMWRSFIRITSMAWNPFPTEHVWKGPFVDLSSVRGLDAYALCSLLQHPPVGWLFGSIGLYVLLSIMFGLYGVIKIGWKSMVCFVPVTVYAFGTMLFLAGWDDFRFFWVVIIVAIPMVLPVLQEALGRHTR